MPFSPIQTQNCHHSLRSVKSLRSNLTAECPARASSEPWPLCPLRALAITAVSIFRLVIFWLISSALSEPRPGSLLSRPRTRTSYAISELWPSPPFLILGHWSAPSSPGHRPAPPSPSPGAAPPFPSPDQLCGLRTLTSFRHFRVLSSSAVSEP